MIERNNQKGLDVGQVYLHQRYQSVVSKMEKTEQRRLLNLISFAGIITHVCFLLLFVTMGQTLLCVINIASIGVWSGTLLLNRKRWFRTSFFLMIGEIVLHATVATILLGTEAGFHFYLWPALGILLVIPRRTFKHVTLLHIPIVTLFIYFSITQVKATSMQGFESLMALLFSINVTLSALPFIVAIRYFQKNTYMNDKKLFALAYTDEYTDAYNRRFIYELLSDGNKEHTFDFSHCSLTLLKIDNLKHINYQYGHAMGESVILSVNSAIKRFMRDTDIIARWSGSQFLILLEDQMQDITEDFLASVKFAVENDIKCLNHNDAVSITTATTFPKDKLTFIEALQKTDKKLCERDA